jgi:hypothetical protein
VAERPADHSPRPASGPREIEIQVASDHSHQAARAVMDRRAAGQRPREDTGHAATLSRVEVVEEALAAIDTVLRSGPSRPARSVTGVRADNG